MPCFSTARAAHALITSKEMQLLLCSSRDVLASAAFSSRDSAVSTAVAAGSFCVHVACLPVTLPLHVASSTTHLLFEVTGNVMELALGSSTRGEHPGQQPPVKGLVQNIFDIVPFVAYQIGGAVGHWIVPVLGGGGGPDQEEGKNKENSGSNRATCSGESTAERESFLDRLRLDIPVPLPSEESEFSNGATPSDISKYLLRVDDVDVRPPPNPAATNTNEIALYIDLGKVFGDEDLTREALAKLRRRALDMSANSRPFGNTNATSSATDIFWKPEGETAKHMRMMSQLSNDEIYEKMQEYVLIWSGKCCGPKYYYGSDTPLFLARGVVQRSPRDFLNLLWNSNRTSEYNNYNLGRSDALIIIDNITNGGNYGAKVVKSETKVPFTGLSLTLSSLMHASSLDDEEGFIIVSRSLNSGMAGCHVGNCKRVETNGKNEILMGVNIMRPVPGKPHLTDFTSLSQVSSSMVPRFLTTRIGVMGVQDFFNTVR
jgi:hypothetical protein